MLRRTFIAWMLILPALAACAPASTQPARTPEFLLREADIPAGRFIPAEMIDAEFYKGDSNYKCLLKASDGKFYYAICCHKIDTHTQMYTFDPGTKKVSHLADMGEVVGEKGKKTIPQGKIHVNIFEHKGKLYTGTHIGFYLPLTKVETPGEAKGYLPYQGGHFVSYDLATGAWEDLAKAPVEEGILTMVMDKQRERLYGLTWPAGSLISYDIPTKEFKILTETGYGKGEWGEREKGEWMFICRTLALDPRDGSLYWSNTQGDIMAYRYDTGKVEKLAAHIRLKEFGDPSCWRQIVWFPKEEVFYGVHMTSSYLFRFDPRSGKIEPLERICGEEFKNPANDGRRGKGPGATLALHLGPDGETIYYLPQGAGIVAKDGRKTRGTVHFVTYHIPTRKYTDHGILRLADGRFPTYAQAIDEENGTIYSVPWIEVPPDATGRAAKIALDRTGNPTYNAAQTIEEINLIRFTDPYLKR
ncbi:MAG: hypothetical protein A2Z34_09210 [Planctomycetes bacterium RBG_16_59_8]|nr:MAG: hypothetical protein A2Z34_09210 [Planctomycetes bacterium RBG_16_59_8]